MLKKYGYKESYHSTTAETGETFCPAAGGHLEGVKGEKMSHASRISYIYTEQVLKPVFPAQGASEFRDEKWEDKPRPTATQS